MTIDTLSGVTSRMVDTDRIDIHVLETGPEDGIPVLFVHGNISSATFWEQTMLALPSGYRGIALDLRGYGQTEALPVDATQGLGDMVEDIRALVEALALERYHIIGHSMGGGIVMKYAIAYPDDLYSITLVDTMSPYGYGGSRGVEARPSASIPILSACWPKASAASRILWPRVMCYANSTSSPPSCLSAKRR